jgi:3-dehydroquinate dehydratase-2
MTQTIFVLNGPNLNMLGKREPGIYGGKTLKDIEADCKAAGRELGFDIDFRQSNHEGALVDWFHEADEKAAGVAINAGAYTHTSVALHDAIRAISIPVVELHISNVHAREEFRHKSMIAPACKGVICGFGPHSYILALHALKNITA